MKKFKIKHVALVAMLAGYSISSVYAADPVSAASAAYIKGHVPILKASDFDPNDLDKADIRSMYMTVRTSIYNGSNDVAATPVRTDKKLQVGDWLVLRYVLTDVDGDPEGMENNTNKNIKFFYKKDSAATAWIEFPSSQELNLVQGSAGGSTMYSEYAIKVPEAITGAGLIGYKIVEKTQFGIPTGDLWYRVPDAFVQGTSLGKGDQTEPGDAGVEDPDSGGNTTIDTDINVCFDADTNCTDGGQVKTALQMYIYKVNAGIVDDTVDYVNAPINPIVGETFAAAVKDRNTGVEVDYANFDNIEWSLTGTNTSAVPDPDHVTAPDFILAAEANKQYTIEVNADIQAKFPAPLEAKAGAQGFTLTATTRSK